MKIAYLVSEYPAISHTFVLREIQALRGLEYIVHTASVRPPKNIDDMTADEKKEASDTMVIQKAPLHRIVKAHWTLLVNRPKHYFKMLYQAVSLSRRGIHHILKCFFYFIEAAILVDWMERKDIGHVHVHFANPAATVALIASFYGTVGYSMSVHGPDIFYTVDTNLIPDKIKNAVFVRCISYFCRSQLMRLVPYGYWSKFHIVRCGVDPDVYTPRQKPDNDIFQMLCVGRLVPAKGQHILLKACSVLRQRGKQFHLTLIGDGDDRKSLEALSRQLGLTDSVTFLGVVGQDRIQTYYDRADVFVLASFSEGVPVVLMEAMAKEIPCVTTRITGIPELIEDGVEGFMVFPSDIDGLADKLEITMADTDICRECGQRGRQKILSDYNINQNGPKMAEVFRLYSGMIP